MSYKGIRKYLIVANETKDVGLKYSEYTKEKILSLGGECLLTVGVDSPDFGKYADSSECIIVMGGDGTMLRVSHAMNGRETLVIGVNLGTVGFLTEVIVSEIDDMLERLFIGDYEIEERMMLTGTVNGETVHSLNDIVLARENALRIIAVKIFVNDMPFDTCEGDGIIIATPTGSTGYNMSAGGPIVKPDAKLMVMTPVSPYSLSRRSVIFGMDDVIRLELTEKRKDVPNTAIVSFDGAETVPVNVGESVTIRMSEHKINLIKLDVSSVYEILRRKLGG